MSELPEDLIVVAGLPDEKEFASMKPPPEVVNAVRSTAAGLPAPEELLLWIDEQRDLQAEADAEFARLVDGSELEDPAARGLPKWFLEDWAAVLRFKWSHKLGEAVKSARSWR